MASHIWIGGAPAVAQVDAVTFPSDVAAGQIINFTIGVREFSITLTGLTRDLIIAEVVSAWNASTIPEVAEMTATAVLDDDSNLTGVMTLTATIAGKPFAVTVSIGSGNNEIQVIALGGTAATGGTFTLSYNGQTTGAIAYNADAATVDTALEALSNIGVGDVTVTGSAGGPWTVEFTGTLSGTNVALMTIDVSNLTGGVNEVQTISSPSNPTGGTFTLSYGGQATAAIAYNAAASAVQSALEALTTIPAGSVACAGGALPVTPVTVTFQDELAAMDVALLVADASGLTGVTGSAAETTPGGSTIKDKTKYYFDFGDASTATADYYKDTVDGVVTVPPAGNFPRVAGGKIDYGWWFDGSSFDNLKSGTSDWATFDNADNYSVSAWVKYDTALAGFDRIICGTGNTSSAEWHLLLNDDGTFSFKRSITNTTHDEAKSVATATINTWHHVVGVWDKTNSLIKISVDGGAFVTAAITSSVNAQSSSYFEIGGTFTNLLGAEHWKGFIDEVGIYSDALTISEVGDVYNSGAGDGYPFPVAGANEVQTLTLSGSPTAGNVTISYQGVGVLVPYDASAATAEALLDTVSTIGSGNTNVTGGPWPGTPLVVEFINDLAVTNVELLVIDTSALTMLVSETTPGVTAPTGTVATTVSPLTKSTTTASEGPNDWSIAANWNTNTVPVTSDTVYISDTEISILYGLDQSAVTLAALHIEQTFSGFIGLPRTNADGLPYFEYRDSYLKIGATTLFIGDKEGDGSDRIKIDLGTVQSTVLITDSGDGEDANTPAILLLGTHASNVININRGSLGVAYYPTEVSTIALLRQAFFDDATDDTTVFLGAGVTITDIIKSGGELDLNSNTTSLEQTAGNTTIHAGAHTLLNILDGSLNYNSVGTLSEINLSGDSVLIFDQDRRPKVVTIINKLSDASEVFDVSGSIANPVIDMENTGDLSTLNMGKNFKLTFGATT